jgi:HD-GYP domain-containing protein (c-di-GMP phosphodiesterase class II)
MKIPEELYSYIISGNCVLFVGAGASIEAGAPSAQEMTRELSKKYLQGKHQEEPLSKVASYIETKPGLGRRLVVDYLINRLSPLKPSKAHLLLPKFRWAAIYTTNYDTLIEQAYERVGVKYKPIMSSCDLVIDMIDYYSYVLLYKPHGCISRPAVSEAPIIITEDDYYSVVDNRKAIYRQLEVHKYKSVFLFIGYSFSDFNLSQIWFDVSKELGRFSQWAYALQPNYSEVQRATWRTRNLELIDMQFGEFMTELSAISFEKREEQEFFISNTNLADLAKVLVSIIEAKDPYMRHHALHVQKLSLLIAEEMAIPIHEYQLLEIAALLHDVGYVAIPDVIVGKSGPLTQAEWELSKQHPIIGEQIFSLVPSLKRIAKIIRHHHERFDGRGYPDGLIGENIPRPARIIAVADSLDAMMSDRPYRRSLKLKKAMAEIIHGSGTRLDPTVVGALKRLHSHNKLKGIW